MRSAPGRAARYSRVSASATGSTRRCAPGDGAAAEPAARHAGPEHRRPASAPRCRAPRSRPCRPGGRASGQLTSKSSRSERWLSYISAPPSTRLARLQVTAAAVQRAGVLAGHVAGAAGTGRIQQMPCAASTISGVASRRVGDPQRRAAASRALGAPARVGAVGQGVLDVAVDRSGRSRRDRRSGTSAPPRSGSRWSSSAAVASPITEAHWSMMPQGTPAKSCSACWQRRAFSAGSRRRAGHRLQQRGRRHLQGGAARQAAAQGHVRHHEPRPGRRDRAPAAGTPRPRRARSWPRPASPDAEASSSRSRRMAVQRRAVQEKRAARPVAWPAALGGRREDDVAVDGHGEHEAVVVVGVLADQVHPPGRRRQPRAGGRTGARSGGGARRRTTRQLGFAADRQGPLPVGFFVVSMPCSSTGIPDDARDRRRARR